MVNSLKRLNVYFKERYPLLPRLLLAFIVFSVVYFIILLNDNVRIFHINHQEVIGAFTIFAFLMWLRIADDFKDLETDRVLFKERPLPSGRVRKSDLLTACGAVQAAALILNVLYMNNPAFIFLLYLYGFLMSQWFFQKQQIQKSLPLALITHNPVQLFINLYVISFTTIKYSLNPLNLTTFLVLFAMYLPSLIWEISRKIRAPEDENDYVTYSKLFGYARATRFILYLIVVDSIINVILVWNLNIISVLLLVLLAGWMARVARSFIKNPSQFQLVNKVERYIYLQLSLLLTTAAAYVLAGKMI